MVLQLRQLQRGQMASSHTAKEGLLLGQSWRVCWAKSEGNVGVIRQEGGIKCRLHGGSRSKKAGQRSSNKKSSDPGPPRGRGVKERMCRDGTRTQVLLVILVPALVLATRRHMFRRLLRILQHARAVAVVFGAEDQRSGKQTEVHGGARGEEKVSCART